MARPNYPSDFERVPLHVRVNLVIRQAHPDFPEHAELFADPELRGAWLGMQVIACANRSYLRDGRAILSSHDLNWISAKRYASAQRAMAERIARTLGYTTHTLGAGLVLELRNAIPDPQWHYVLGSGAQRGAAEEPPPPPVQTSLPGFSPLGENVEDAFLLARQAALDERARVDKSRARGGNHVDNSRRKGR